MKSNYPNKIDTQRELEIVKDNLTELRSSLFNSYRSAIIQIEKTLGVNPNGEAGLTVASRLNTSLDEAGNIKPEALDYLNLLSGPIEDFQVKDDAKIKESKLNLDFSTNFLYNQALSLERLINELNKFLDEISAILSAHINKSALNRHFAKSIDIEEVLSGTHGSSALTSLDAQSIQEFAEKIIFNHVKFSGSSLNSENNSHSSNQIFFDNTNVQDLIADTSLQSVIESIVLGDAEYLREVLINLSANGRVRSGVVSNLQSGSDGEEIDSGFCYQSSVNSDGTIDFSLSSSKTITKNIDKLDLVKITGFVDSSYDKYYYISENYLSSNPLTSIKVYGSSIVGDTSTLEYSIIKNNYVDYNSAGMNLSVRYSTSGSSAPYIYSCSPNSAKVVSDGIRPYEISSSNNNLTISVDGTDFTIDIFTSGINQTLDSIIAKINQYSSTNKKSFGATKVSTAGGFELCVFNAVPNIAIDDSPRTISIKNSNAISSLGFSNDEDVVYTGLSGNTVIANGKMVNDHFKSLSLSDFTFGALTSTITRVTGSFISDGITKGSFVFVEGTNGSADDGLYVIKSVNDLSIELDHTFSTSSSGSNKVFFIGNGIDFSDFKFSEIGLAERNVVSGDGSMLFDIYYNEKERCLFADKKMEIAGLKDSSNMSIMISNYSENLVLDGEEAEISLDSTTKEITLTQNSQAGDSVVVSDSGKYVVYNKTKTKFVELNIIIGALLENTNITIKGTSSLDTKTIKVGSFIYSNDLGTVFGTGSGGLGITHVQTKISSGPIDESKISDSFVENKISKPLFESIGNYIAFGLDITDGSVSYDSSNNIIELSLDGGIAYISGRRISKKESLTMSFGDIDASKKYFLVITKDAEVLLKEEISSGDYSGYASSFDKEELCVAVLEISGSSVFVTPLRAGLDSINDKIDKVLYVSPNYTKISTVLPNKKKAHFDNIQDAINYSKYYRETSGSSYKPKVCLLDGHYHIGTAIEIDHSIEIFGLTKEVYIHPTDDLLRTGDISSSSVLISDSNCIFNISKNWSDSFVDIKFKNITFDYVASAQGVFAAILVAKNSSNNIESSMVFENLVFKCTSGTYSSPTSYHMMIPIIFQHWDTTTAVLDPQIFKNIFFRNLKFNSLFTGGYCVKFFTAGASNLFENIVSENCLISSPRTIGGVAQMFGCGNSIDNTATIFSTTAGIINGVSEIRTVIS